MDFNDVYALSALLIKMEEDSSGSHNGILNQSNKDSDKSNEEEKTSLEDIKKQLVNQRKNNRVKLKSVTDKINNSKELMVTIESRKSELLKIEREVKLMDNSIRDIPQ